MKIDLVDTNSVTFLIQSLAAETGVDPSMLLELDGFAAKLRETRDYDELLAWLYDNC